MAAAQIVLGPCRLLDLPAELRNQVYELVATQDTQDAGTQDNKRPINFFAARPPGGALLQLSKQIKAEASGIVTQAAKLYWSSNRFIADVSSQTETTISNILDRLGDHPVNLITEMAVYGTLDSYLTLWKLSNGDWTVKREGRFYMYYVDVVDCTGEQILHLRRLK